MVITKMTVTENMALNRALAEQKIIITLERDDRHSDWKAYVDTSEHDRLIRADERKKIINKMLNILNTCEIEILKEDIL